MVALLGFGSSPTALAYAASFAVVYGLSAPGLALFSALSGALQGAGATRLPFLSRLTGMFGFFVGLSWLLGRTAGLGPAGAYVGVLLAYAWMALVVIAGFRYSGWADRAAELMAERGSGDEPGAPSPDE